MHPRIRRIRRRSPDGHVWARTVTQGLFGERYGYVEVPCWIGGYLSGWIRKLPGGGLAFLIEER